MAIKPSVLFVCVHNAGRSQMAAGFLTHLAGGQVEVRSAGSIPGDRVNPSAVAAMAEVGIDISHQTPKVLTTDAVQSSDVVITMGCGDACPIFPGKRYLDWDLEDPAGQGVEAVGPIRDEIHARVQTLLTELLPDQDPARAANRQAPFVVPRTKHIMCAPEDIREIVRRRYAEAATRSAAGDHEQARVVETSCCGAAPAATTDLQPPAVGTSCCGPTPVALTDKQDRVVFGAELYGPEAGGAPEDAVAASLGCGVPTAVADLHPGEVVLDLGSGAGADVLISARRVAPGGRAIGLDMTDEMLELARRNATEAGVDNVEFLKGYLEDIPLPDGSVDVVISNCVINLAADKNVVLAEAARVLRLGGRLAFSDVIADEDMDEMTKADMAEWTGCIAGALTDAEFTQALTSAGFTDIEIRPTHRVHTHAQAALIRASR